MLPRKAKKELELEQKEQQKELIWLQQYWEQTTEQGVEKAFTTKELYYIGVTELILFKLFEIFFFIFLGEEKNLEDYPETYLIFIENFLWDKNFPDFAWKASVDTWPV